MPRMNLSRRSVVSGLAASTVVPVPAIAETYPARTVKIVVPYAAGGAVDVVARLVANGLQKQLGQTFIIENKPGASANLGADSVAKAAADGYTLLVTANAIATNMVLFNKLPFNTLTDLQPVMRIGYAPLVMVAPPELPANTLQELIALAKAKPDELTYASTGNGSSNHLATELFKIAAGINIQHVSYRGGAPALTDLLGNRISIMIINPTEALPYLQAKKLKAIAVAHDQRLPLFPDVPTTRESGLPGVEASVWWGMLAPAKTPDDVVQKLNAELQRALADPETLGRFTSLGITTSPGSSEDFKSFLVAEIERWRGVIKAANIRPD